MRVRVHSLVANPNRIIRPDTVVTLPDRDARALVDAGYATEEPEPQPAATATGGAPARTAPKSAWVDYAVDQGADRDGAEALSKSELVELYG